MPLTYSITLVLEGETVGQITLDAHSDAAAVRQLRKWLDENVYTINSETLVYLEFFRTSDGQHGYLNPDGASPVGSAWPLKKNRAAVSLGRKGGKVSVSKGFGKMTPEQRAEAGRNGAAKRWGKVPK